MASTVHVNMKSSTILVNMKSSKDLQMRPS
ncbi:hypothetical protein CCACVL1_10122 [Corchorus capsularis]|uniref:Uncharacterized protein n=1 Tax=Corchorus capsularis TaxID=210143 RepID=A0A1R3ISN4_COCAP|nr:hypothetical protein CCACVL1_10122 [Corchorus capsularis]